MRRDITKLALCVAGGALCLISGSYLAFAQAPAAGQGPARERHAMNFFVTSVGLPGGANLHGLAGADAHCADLARAATGDRTLNWHAYLSTQERGAKPAINARDRIGKGPWYNANGVIIAKDVDDLHGSENNIHKAGALTELGQMVPGEGAPADPRDQSWAYMQSHPYSIRHEILTGSQRDGRAFPPDRDHTCNHWTSAEEGNTPLRARNNTGPGAENRQVGR